ncbi:phosphoglycerate mutase family protein [Xylogone sp. PMI_703]|nr:phosphoglycerate mutase family protein [Xylogone sp. PMI_703]
MAPEEHEESTPTLEEDPNPDPGDKPVPVPVPEHHIEYTTIAGYFLQDAPATNPAALDYTTTNFGLIDRRYSTDAEFDPERSKTQWQRFEYMVNKLNEKAEEGVQYKILFMGRHGQGDHNVAESFYGTKAWDCYWSMKDGNDTTTWADANLTPKGRNEALIANNFWSSLLTTQFTPAPESYYVSPLSRCLETCKLTFTDLPLPSDRPFKPTIKELFREVIGVHTCDRRSTKSHIHEAYPEWVFEEGFTEEDELWKGDQRETHDGMDIRTRTVLDDVFSHDKNTWISITSHSGEIASILRVLRHREFDLGTGQAIPVLVKAETVEGQAPTPSGPPQTTVSTCSAPPTARTA